MQRLQQIALTDQHENRHGRYRRLQQAPFVSSSCTSNRNPNKHSQRTGPLSILGRVKAAAIRKQGAYFRCGALKIGVSKGFRSSISSNCKCWPCNKCDEVQPCSKCEKATHIASRTRTLKYLRCLVHTVSDYSIYMPGQFHAFFNRCFQALIDITRLQVVANFYAKLHSYSRINAPTDTNTFFSIHNYSSWLSRCRVCQLDHTHHTGYANQQTRTSLHPGISGTWRRGFRTFIC